MSSDKIESDLDTSKAETLILLMSRELGLEEHEGLELQGVKITFEKINTSKKRMCNPNIDGGILHVQLRDVSLVSGVKLYFATLVKMMEGRENVPLPHIVLISFYYPISVFTLSLLLVGSFFISDFRLALIFGPALFTVLVVPTLFWIAARSRDRTRNKLERIKSKLNQISFFANKHEITEYSQLVSERFIFGLTMSFLVYIVLVLFLSIIAIFGFG